MATAFLAGAAMIAVAAKEAGLGADDPAVRESAKKLAEDLKKQFDRKICTRALRRRHAWRKADVANLLLLPGKASEATQRQIRRVAIAKDKNGRGVVPTPETFEEALGDGFSAMSQMADPATSFEERCKLHAQASPWHGRLIEAAYRGELAKQRLRHAGSSEPHLPLSEIAEDKVGKAAGISRSQVHQLCQLMRDERSAAERRAATRSGHAVELDSPMTAAELKRHLSQLP